MNDGLCYCGEPGTPGHAPHPAARAKLEKLAGLVREARSAHRLAFAAISGSLASPADYQERMSRYIYAAQAENDARQALIDYVCGDWKP